MNTENELVSIITPVFNAAQYIEETANSIIAQSYSNWEWLVVDDCSTDDSYKILKDIASKDKRIKLMKNDTNSRAFATRNKGLENVSGKFVAFLDADDLWPADKLELQINFMISNNYFVTYTGFKRFRNIVNEEDAKIVKVPSEATYSKIISNNYIATSTVIINVNEVGPLRMKDVYYDDFVLWLELLGKIPFAYGINETLMYYRLSPNSLSRNKIKSAIKVYGIFRNSLHLSWFNSRFLFLKWSFYTTKRYLLSSG